MAEQDYYRLLGVSRDAPERHIKKAYYELARKLHPDKAASTEEAARNQSQLAAISKAYNVLKDKKKREEYDQKVRGKSTSGGGNSNSAPAASSAPAAPQPPAKGGDPVPEAPATEQGGAQRKADAGAMHQQRVQMAQKAFVKGMQYFKRQEMKKAVEFFEVAVKNDPESEPQYHLKYAQALIRTKGSFTKAVESAKKACEMEPYNVEFKMVLADVYEMAGVMSKAKETLEEVLKWEEDNQAARNRLKLLQVTSGGGASGGGGGFLSKLFGKKK